MENNRIIEGLKSGDSNVFDYVYTNNIGNIKTILDKYSIYSIEADDVFQESIMIAINNIKKPNFLLTCKFSTYFYKICENLSLKSYSKNRRIINVGTDYSYFKDVEDMTLELDEICGFEIFINELSKTEKDVIKLYYYENMSMVEIAKKLNFKNANTSKTKKYKAMKNLKQFISNRNLKKEDFLN